ncbi:mucin-2-like [Scylla paramamosain]|uniref:mucin-2-like n=1 Tax=Scylla paramamosain TaxID=85552 RepID=UPI003083CA7D
MAQKFSLSGVLPALCLLLLAVYAQGLQVCPSLSCPTPAGFFAHPTNCDSYVKCSHGVVTIKQCPEGLDFNPEMRRCDYPRLAQCNITARLVESGCSLKTSDPKTRLKLDLFDSSESSDSSDSSESSESSESSGSSESSVECDCDCCLKPHDMCTKYYECVQSGEAVVRECSDGLVFNPHIENCDFPSNYQCPTTPPVCECDCRYPVEGECNAFYDCKDGEPEKKYCPDGLFFNPETNVCDLNCHQTTPRPPTTTTTTTTTPEPTTTTTTPEPTTTTTTTTTPEPTTTTTSTTTPEPTTTTTTTTTPEPTTTTTTTTTPEPTTTTTTTTTPEPTTTTTTTTTPEPTTTTTTTTTPEPTTTTTTTTTPEPTTTTTTTTTPEPTTTTTTTTPPPPPPTTTTTTTTTPKPITTTTVSPFPCVDCSGGQQYFPHPTDCRKFIQCAPYGPQEMPCAEGTIWNQWLLTCDHEDITPCVTGSYVGPDGNCVHPVITTPKTTTTTTTTITTKAPVTTPDGSVCDVACPAAQGLFPHPQKCGKWVHCDHNIPYVKDCPAGLHFNPRLKVCDWPQSAGCTSGPDHICEIPTPVPTTPAPNATEPTASPMCDCACCHKPADDCTAYYYCDEDQSLSYHKCSEGLVFHPDFDTCVYADMYPQCIVTEPPPVCLCDCYYPSEVCSSYYHCDEGVPVKLDCPEGLYWNQDKKSCDLPQFVNCTMPIRRRPHH